MKTIITALFLSACSLLASEKSPAGVYQSEAGLYVLTVTLLTNGNYLARWDGDIGPNGTAAGSWEFVDGEVRLTPKKEEGHPMTGYLRVLLVRQFEGRQALLRKEDVANEANPFFYLYLKRRPIQSVQHNAGSRPHSSDFPAFASAFLFAPRG